MIRSLASIGRMSTQGTDELDAYTRDLGPDYKRELAVLYSKSGNQVTFVGTELREKDSSRRYLYRREKGNIKYPSSPTLPYSSSGEPLATKLAEFFADAEPEWMKAVYTDLKKRIPDIAAALDELSKSGRRVRENPFVTFVLVEDDVERYPGDVDDIRKVFRARVIEGEDDGKGVCYACGREGGVSAVGNQVFKISTFDKPCFAVGLKQENAWKNYPLCKDCRRALEAGRRRLDRDLTYRFYGGTRLWIVPKPVLASRATTEDILYLIEGIPEDIRNFLNQAQAGLQAEMEIGISSVLRHAGEWVTFDFVFHRASNSQEQVLLYVEDIMPSRFAAIDEARRAVNEKLEDFPCVFGDEIHRASPSFGTVFTALRDNQTIYEKTFFDYVDCIFRGAPIDLRPFVQGFLRHFSERLFKTNGPGPYTWFTALEAWAIWLLAVELGLINNRGEASSQVVLEGIPEFTQFFQKYSGFFVSPQHRQVFLTGVLTRKLIDVQLRERGSAPFLSKLRGLKMTKGDVTALLPEIINKLSEYEKQLPWWKAIESQIALEALSAGHDWQMPTEELNYVFALGLSLGQHKPFKREKEESADE